ncbi:MAG: sigma-70 family RNA polymerase sigma factor [Planctomycetes bacterium]|nr:sigma-70 family RNA polymerase sigma factor [Planctomycetota bacterium]
MSSISATRHIIGAMPPSSSPSSEHLLSQLAWVQNLARTLVSDPNLADDLVQETWVAVLKHPPAADRSPRGWLATVVRNFARESRRSTRRRQRREQATARPESIDSTINVVAKASAHQELVETLLSLEEPYRSTLLLRFFDDLPPRKIAQQLGIPVATVKTRLARGLDQLRGRLDEGHGGDRHAWVLAILPLARRGRDVLRTGIGTAATKAKLQIAAVSVTAIATVVGVTVVARNVFSDRASTEVVSTASPAPQGAAVAITPKPASSAATDAEPSEPSRKPLETKPAKSPIVPIPDIESGRLRGRVLSQDGKPLAGVEIQYRPYSRFTLQMIEVAAPQMNRSDIPRFLLANTIAGISEADGSFEMDAPEWPGEFFAVSPKLVTVMPGIFKPGVSAIDPIVVVARSSVVTGRVVAEDGSPIDSAVVRLAWPDTFRRGLRTILDSSRYEVFATATSADGRFTIATFPEIDGIGLSISQDGFESREVPPHPEASPDGTTKDIVLRRLVPSGTVLHGRVVDSDGAAAPGARVSAGAESTTTDATGGFALAVGDAKPPWRLTAVTRGTLPGFADVPAHTPDNPSTPAAPIEIRLDGRPMTIVGQVVDDEGNPLTGAWVWITDPVHFGKVNGRAELVESLISGNRDSFVSITDAKGRFVIKSLLSREYHVQAMSSESLARSPVQTVTEESGEILLSIPGFASLPDTVEGRVVTRSGEPVGNVAVVVTCEYFRSAYSPDERYQAARQAIITEADGRFSIACVPHDGVFLRIDGDRIVPREFALADDGPRRGLEIVVSRRCHFRLELGEPVAGATRFSVLDAEGNLVPLNTFLGVSRDTSAYGVLDNGISNVYAVDETARTLVLKTDGSGAGTEIELRRIPIELEPGKLNVITH